MDETPLVEAFGEFVGIYPCAVCGDIVEVVCIEDGLNDSVVYRGKPVEWDKAAAADDTKPENDLLMMIRPMRILLYHKGTLVGECTAE